MRFLEYFTFLVFIFGFYFYMMLWPGGTIMILTSLMSLSCLYFFLGFSFLNNIRLRNILKKESYSDLSTLRIIGAIVAGVNLSVLLIGLLFRLMRWPGATFMLFVTFLPSLIILGVAIIKQINTSQRSYLKVITRTGFFLAFAAVLYFQPMVLQKIRYKDYPKLIKAMEEYDKNPNEYNGRILDIEFDKTVFSEEEFRALHRDSIPY